VNVTAVENFVLFNTLLSLGGFAAARIARTLKECGLWHPHPFTLTRIYAASVALPPLVAVWIVAAAFIPVWSLGEPAFDRTHPGPLHQLHLFGNVTAPLEPFLCYATVIFLVFAGIFAIWSSLRAYSRIASAIQHLEMNVSPPPAERIALVEQIAARHNLAVGLVMSNYPLSFVWGYFNSKLVLSSGLLHETTSEELTGLLEHEAAHNSRRDNLMKLALSVCSYTSMAFPLMRRVLSWRALEVEMVCDEIAAARTSRPLDIAEGLMKLTRRTLAPSLGAMGGTSTSGFVPQDASSIEVRVSRLIKFTDQLPDPLRARALSKTNKAEAFLTVCIFISSLIAVSVWAPLAVHRAAESLIRIIA